ncbi:sigma-54-dependent transcriptional regulator [Desulfopila aestuarii]|uniref:Two-component system, NtrC family, response regulator AtoC n=1 Tax=Desulfopila aestuarii DSM 18488 TaxID=1121416 RepID=A0A1M7XVG3_9BACT|nr:sigma-54 dependent transcriptional regulator [Desulfopila aestuarii]SHO42546.1 two-component system, NtrC family, response regulator AtoC [Desulfopila aestuarii DSM 18488]
MIRIMLAEDDEIMRITIQDRLQKYNWQVDVATDGKEAIAMLDRNSYRVILSDVRMPNLDGMALLQHVREVAPYTDIIMMTGYGNVESGIACLQQGAADYLLKPFDMDDLVIRINRILAVQNLKARNISLEDHCRQQQQQLIGSGPAMQEVYRLIEQAAPSDASILITGESGTGKELVAEAIHSASKRRKQPYIRLNCAAIPEGLMESEMFGHEKGAFTGAVKQKIGKFEMANGGTLLLDEIADLPLALQPKLLRVLQERELDRVGGNRTVKVDVRIICATAKDLSVEVEKGNFRQDLFYRLRVIPIKLPPLRFRKEDIPELTQHFLHHFSLKRGVAMSLAPEAMARLLDYDFPGNVRELRNILERTSVLAQEPTIGLADLPSDLRGKEMIHDSNQSLVLAEALARTEKKVILKALNKAGGVRQDAAELLGISRKNLWEKMKLYAIQTN